VPQGWAPFFVSWIEFFQPKFPCHILLYLCIIYIPLYFWGTHTLYTFRHFSYFLYLSLTSLSKKSILEGGVSMTEKSSVTFDQLASSI
jgi:hypothetical protein